MQQAIPTIPSSICAGHARFKRLPRKLVSAGRALPLRTGRVARLYRFPGERQDDVGRPVASEPGVPPNLVSKSLSCSQLQPIMPRRGREPIIKRLCYSAHKRGKYMVLPDKNNKSPAKNASGRSGPRGKPDSWRGGVPPSQATAKRVFLTCHYCSYSPPTVPEDGKCPKCGGHSWERFALAARVLPRHLQ